MAAPFVSPRPLDALLLDSQSLHAPQASAERYRAIADSSFDLICELNAECQFVYLSPSFGATTGLEPGALLGTSLFELLQTEDKALFIAEFTVALSGLRVGRSEHRLRSADGDWRCFESALRGIGTGEDRRVVMVSRETTSRQRHQLELETLIALAKDVHNQSDLTGISRSIWNHLSPLLPATTLLLAWRDQTTKNEVLHEASNEVLSVCGQNLDTPVQSVIARDLHADCPLWNAFSNSQTQVENIWKEGICGFDFNTRSFVIVPLGTDGDTLGALFFASDKPFVWTEETVRLCQMAGEQAAVAVRGVGLLRLSKATETKYRDLVNDVDAIVWESDDVTLQPNFVSPQAVTWLGYPLENWIDQPRFWERVVHAEDQRRVAAEVRANAETTEPWHFEFRARTIWERELWMRCLVTPEVQDGRVVKMRGLILDVTERRRHMEEILESNAILAATQEASADGICLVNERGNVVSFNRRFAEMWAISPALGDELRDKRELMACVLAEMRAPEEFIEKMNFLRQNPDASSRDEIVLRDGRIFERHSAPAVASAQTALPLDKNEIANDEISNGEIASDGASKKSAVKKGRGFGRVWTFSDITERKNYEQQLAHQAFHDSLTDLPNRTLFLDRVEHALTRLDRVDKALAVLFIDLDRFKIINDTMGHEKGDYVLQEFSRRLQATLRPGDTAARFGGDEFTLLLEDLQDVEDAKAITDRLIEALRTPFLFDGREIEITSSIGVAMSFSAQDRAGDLLRNADIAMYRAKNKGKARFEVFDTQMSAAALERLQLEIELRQAVKWGQLRLNYQPLIDLETAQVIGTEALVRWDHPERGLISPADFIPIAEESGMILPIGAWVLREACRQARAWQTQFPMQMPLKMSVNLSAKQIQGSDIVAQVAQILEETGLDASCLELELTESAVMEDAEATVTILENLKKLGVKLALDDFGTGYSSLAYLERFPLDVLKIDRSFVAKIGKNGHGNGSNINSNGHGKSLKNGCNERSVIMQAVQTLGLGLGMAITAEGIETTEQLTELRDLGCAIGQGFYWAKPLTATALAALLQSANDAISVN